MAPSRPQVLTGLQLPDLVQYLLDNDSPSSVLVVCASKPVFVEQLLHATHLDSNPNDDQPTSNTLEPEPANEPSSKARIHPLLNHPTLHQLATSRKINLVCCPELVHLRAYLSTLAIPSNLQSTRIQTTEENNPPPLLAILNPIAHHRTTSSFSAQGLNRTFALAVEAAHATDSQLLMVECPSPGLSHDPTEVPGDAGYDYDFETEIAGPPQAAAAAAAADFWEEEISILNVTTKSFGAGGRGWVGRTVTVRRVAERWFVFSALQGVEWREAGPHG